MLASTNLGYGNRESLDHVLHRLASDGWNGNASRTLFKADPPLAVNRSSAGSSQVRESDRSEILLPSRIDNDAHLIGRNGSSLRRPTQP